MIPGLKSPFLTPQRYLNIQSPDCRLELCKAFLDASVIRTRYNHHHPPAKISSHYIITIPDLVGNSLEPLLARLIPPELLLLPPIEPQH